MLMRCPGLASMSHSGPPSMHSATFDDDDDDDDDEGVAMFDRYPAGVSSLMSFEVRHVTRSADTTATV